MARKRGGRPRKQNVDRQPDGRPKPEKDDPPDEVYAQRCQSLARVIALHPEPTARKLVRDPDAEWYIGRLRLAGVITAAERDAAHGWKQAAEEYARLLMVPKQPVALDMSRREHSPAPAFEDEATIARFKRVKRRYERYWDAVADQGIAVLRATTAALNGEEQDIELLRRGLQALLRA